ncbi:MAG: prepilin peptidase [Gemmatimonadales bacterium]|jgi:leader peptidase (prepilin peptidase)/N-methyltransferase
MSEPFILAYAALIGLSFGSFLNVCIVRLPKGESIFRPRSRCMSCGRQITWYENIPVLSWLALRGRCLTCKAPISVQYPLVELATGAIWVGAYLAFGLSWQALSAAIFCMLLLGIAVTDAREYIIPDEFSLGGLVLGLALSVAPGSPSPLMSLIGAALSFALMYGVAVVGEWAFKKPALGGGDIKMMAMVGAFLGPLYALLTIFVGSLVGAVIFGPIGLKTGKLVPFGVFLAIGAAVVLLCGEALVGWYAAHVLGF